MSASITRRMLLRDGALGAAALALPGIFASRLSFAAPASGEQRFVLVLLRGALDGLAAAPPIGDPDYARLRGALSLDGAGTLLQLDDLFALHPALQFLGEQWQQRRLTLLHAVATPYRERSHFDAQDVLETGFARPHAAQSGWLNRALAGLPRGTGGTAPAQPGVALGAGVPMVMRGAIEVASWSPGRQRQLEDDTLLRLADLYAGDALLSRRLADARAAQQLAGSMEGMAGPGSGSQLAKAAKTAAGFLLSAGGPRIAVMETTGWDTHANQGREQGALAARLGALDNALRTLQMELGAAWAHTTVLVATEFGRTVAVNGTNGTDHGTGAAAFLVGGAVRGRVLADWPGLAAPQLYQGRDLAPTLDLRAVIKSLLRDHLGVGPEYLDRQVFPDSGKLPWIAGLV
ncbi:MAG: DUF1501 domain-containing protein [Steroidobacteraceae bacterium]